MTNECPREYITTLADALYDVASKPPPGFDEIDPSAILTALLLVTSRMGAYAPTEVFVAMVAKSVRAAHASERVNYLQAVAEITAESAINKARLQ